MKKATKLIETMYTLVDEINEIYRKIDYNLEPLFFLQEEKEQLQKEDCELSFKNIIFYLYRLFFERGKLNVEVVSDYSHLVNLEKNNIWGIINNVHDFRTRYGHYLDMNVKHDKLIRKRCVFWFYSYIAKETPATKEEWLTCEKVILEEAINSLEIIKEILNEIINRNQTTLYEQWRMKQKRDIPLYKKITILDEIKRLYNFSFDSEMLYKKKQSEFDMILAILDFNEESEVESILFREYEKIVFELDVFPCPLSGKEVSKQFDISGKELELVMKKVNEYYKIHNTSTKDELLDYIQSIS